jgi:16S rRNA processing protein RimM
LGRDFYLIAKILSVYGKDGFVKITSYSDFPERFFDLKFVFVDFFGEKRKIRVENIHKLKNSFVMKLENFNTQKDCGFLVGKDVFVDSENLIKLPENTFFIHDLIGSRVFQGTVLLGTLSEVFSVPSNDVYVITGTDEKEILIPAAAAYIESFDSGNKILKLKQDIDFIGEYED